MGFQTYDSIVLYIQGHYENKWLKCHHRFTPITSFLSAIWGEAVRASMFSAIPLVNISAGASPRWKPGTSLRTASWTPWSLSPLHSSSPPLSSSREERLLVERWGGNCSSRTHAHIHPPQLSLTHAHTHSHTRAHAPKTQRAPEWRVPKAKHTDRQKQVTD